MSLISRIISEDLENCDEIIIRDPVLKDLEKEMYKYINMLDRKSQLKFEEVISKFNARIGRICYTQGLFDTCEFLIDIKRDPLEIIKEHNL